MTKPRRRAKAVPPPADAGVNLGGCLRPAIMLLVIAGLLAWCWLRGDPAEQPAEIAKTAPGFDIAHQVPPPIPVAEDPRGCTIEPKVIVGPAPARSSSASDSASMKRWRPKTTPPPYAGGDYRGMRSSSPKGDSANQ